MRRRAIITLMLLGIGICTSSVQAQQERAKIDPNLRAFVHGETRHSYVPILAIMASQSSATVPKAYDTAGVMEYLQWQVNQGWRRVSDNLQSNYEDNSNHIQPRHLFFLNQSFSALVSVEGLRRLSYAPGVQKIYFNYELSLDDPFPSPDYSADLGQIPSNFKAIGLDRLIQEQPQLDGRGVIIGAIDTGVDATHIDLAGKVPFMFRAEDNQLVSPSDRMFHGTHVSGILVGGDRNRRFIGVAPRSTLVMASAVNIEEYLLSMHYMLDTDGRPASYYDLPRAVNNSWNSMVVNSSDFFGETSLSDKICSRLTSMPDQEPFYRAISAWEAAGILPVFSAGNCGPGGGTITPPKEHPATITVGSIGQNGLVVEDSSRGPARFQNQITYKPELVAPGQGILSTMPGGRYQQITGTSQAAPHVTGTIALMAQVHPRLTPADIKDILLRTATSRSADGGPGDYGHWNPNYGYGALNTYEAVKMAYQWANPRSAFISSAVMWPFSAALRKKTSLTPQRGLQTLATEFPEELETDNWLSPDDLFGPVVRGEANSLLRKPLPSWRGLSDLPATLDMIHEEL